MKIIPPGSIRRENIWPKPEHLASALGNHGVDVVSTPSMILYFETVANNLASEYYEVDEVSVGTHVCIDHLAPADGAQAVTIEAELILQKGRRLEFSMKALQDGKLIMEGVHHRAVVLRENFSAPADEASRRTIEFWFDFHSPWCYFASHQIADIARESNARLIWKPVHLANLNAAVDGRRPLEANPNFVAWYQQDTIDTAHQLGVPYQPHKEYPCRPSRALRAAIYAAEQGLAPAFVNAIMRGYWSEQKDISDLNWVCEIAEKAGLDADATRAAALDRSYKEKLAANLQEAINNHFFGLPVAWVDKKIFWGNDRLPLLRNYLRQKN